MKRALSSSNLPNETPLRVRSNSIAGGASTSKFSGQRSSYRKSTIGANRFSTGRPSLAGSNRRSSAQEGNRDIRSHTDKESLQKNLQTIISFLQDPAHRYPYALSPKMQTGPTAKDVTNMFEFIVKIILVDYVEGKKFEEEFPCVLKTMNFPYTIAKRNLQPVASLHNWPTIVYGLAWLCSAAKYFCNLEDDPLVLKLDNSDGIIRRQGLRLAHKAYNNFLSDDSITAENICEDFIADLPNMMGGMEDVKVVDDLRERLLKLEEELANLEKNKIDSLATADSTNKDVFVLDKFLEQLDVYLNGKETDYTTLKNEHEICEKEIVDLKDAIKSKEEIVKNQRMSPDDVHQLSVRLKFLTSQLLTARETLKRVRDELADKDLALNKIREMVLSNIEEYNAAASACQLTPANALNAQGFDYAIHVTSFDSEVHHDISNTEGRLNIMLKLWKEASRVTQKGEMQAVENITLLEQSLKKKKTEISEMESQLERVLESLKLTEQEHANELRCYKEELVVAEKECTNVRKTIIASNEEIESLRKNVNARSDELAEQRARCNEENEKRREFLADLCELILDHKDNIEGMHLKFEQFVKSFTADWRDVLEGKSPKLNNAPNLEELRKLHQDSINLVKTIENERNLKK